VDRNDAQEIHEATATLMREIMQRNALRPKDVVSCIFTATDDLDAEFPAAAARALGFDGVPLLCAREMAVPDAMPRVIRVLNRYPDPANSLLRERLSDRYGVARSRIAIGNGSCDILLAAGEALLEPGAELVYAWPSFSVYPHLAAASGARAVTVALDAGERHDLEAMLAEVTVATRLVLVCNPNNPTSTAIPLASIAQFLAEAPRHVCVIVDEAYCE